MGKKRKRAVSIQLLNMHGPYIAHVLIEGKEAFVNLQFTTKRCRVCRKQPVLSNCRQDCGSEGPKLPLFRNLQAAREARLVGATNGTCPVGVLRRIINAEAGRLVVEVGKDLPYDEGGVRRFEAKGKMIKIPKEKLIKTYDPHNKGKKLSRKKKKAAMNKKTTSTELVRGELTYERLMEAWYGGQ